MPVDSTLVVLPRFTTLCGATTFTTLPMDVSSYGGAQFQVWRGPFRTKAGGSPPTFTIYLQESLDCANWVLGPDSSGPHVIVDGEQEFFSYDFRLRWFRLSIEITGNEPMVSCWAEGLLRGGGGGLWNIPGQTPAGMVVDINRFGTPKSMADRFNAYLNWKNDQAVWKNYGGRDPVTGQMTGGAPQLPPGYSMDDFAPWMGP